MTIDMEQPLGQGVLVPCTQPVTSIEDLSAEASALWKAEQSSASAGRLGAKWGCVGTLFRRESVPSGLVCAWANHFGGTETCAVPPVDADGLLGIPWPLTVSSGQAADYDIILATATKAEEMRPGPNDIADAWIKQNKGYEQYYFKNIENGIRTEDDGPIWKRISAQAQAPRWLEDGSYARAVEILKAEAAGPTRPHVPEGA